MQVKSKTLTSWKIVEDGTTVAFGFVDASGVSATVELPLDQVGALAMTLPGVIEKALQTKYRDSSLRYAYPLSSWAVERGSDQKTGMMTLRTEDGFSVCFSISEDKQGPLGEALVSQPAAGTSLVVN